MFVPDHRTHEDHALDPRGISRASAFVRRSRPTLLALFVALVGLLPVAARGENLDELLRDLTGADAARRATAVKKLAEAGAAEAPRVAKVASSAETDEVRLAALESLSRNSMAYAYSYVFWNALPADDVSEEADVRARHVLWGCLVRVGDAFITVGEFGAASDHYCDLLESASSMRERASVIRGLGRASRRRAAEEVFAALEDSEPGVRRAALDAVAVLRWGQAQPHLERILDTAKPSLIVGLLGALSRRREPDAAAVVERYLDDEETKVRAAAHRARARHHGFVTEWLVSGPIADSDRVLAETDARRIAKARPREGAAVELGEQALHWQSLLAAGSNGAIDTARALGRDKSVGALAYTEIAVEKATRVRLGLTCGGAAVCWLNGKRVDAPGGAAKNATVVAELVAGTNRLLVRISGEGQRAGVFCLRITDETGAPVIVAPPPALD